MFHLSVLAFLERYKNRLGELQHVWLVASTRALGLSRFLLPMPKLQPAGAAAGDETGAATAGAAPPLSPDGLSSAANNIESIDQRNIAETSGNDNDDDDDDEEALVGPPMPRPPPGWDDLMGGAQGRWAWGEEPKSPLELNVAARNRPSHCLLRLLALFAASWIAVLVLAMSGAFLPLWLGRGLLGLLHVPSSLGHDPLAFGGGAALLVLAAPTLKTWVETLAGSEMVAAVLRRTSTRNRRRTTSGEGDRDPGGDSTSGSISGSDPAGADGDRIGLRGVPLRVWWVLAAFGGLWLVATPLLVGLFFEAAVVTSAKDWADSGLRSLHPFHDWALGLLLVHLWAAVAAAGYLGDPNKHRAAPRDAGGAAAAGDGVAGAGLDADGAGENRGDANPAVGFVALAAGAAAPLGYGPVFVAPPVGGEAGDGGALGGGGRGNGGAMAAAVGGGSWETRIRAARSALEAVSEGRWDEVTWDVLVKGLALPALLGVLQLTVPPAAAAIVGASLMARSDNSDVSGNSSSDGSSLADDESSLSASSAGAAVELSAAAALATGSLLSLFRRALATSLLFSLAARLAAPAAAMAQALHDQLRDDEYLVGLELQDFEGRPGNPSEAATAASSATAAARSWEGAEAGTSASSSPVSRGASTTPPTGDGSAAAAAEVVAEAALAAASDASAAAAGTGVC